MENKLMVLNIDDVQIMSLQLAQKIKERPDLVAFVAKGAYLIGQTIAEYFDVPLLEIEAVRSGNQLKNWIKPMLRFLPNGVKVWLRKKEMNMGVHAQKTDRHVTICDSNNNLEQDYQTILLVDDSVDTGNTMLTVKLALQKAFPKSHIITASLFVFESSKTLVNVDYFLYGDTFFSAPWSSDSAYHKDFMVRYSKMKTKGMF